MGKPLAFLGAFHACPASNGPVPHVGGPTLAASPNVFVGGLPAARQGDKLVCVGPPDTVTGGSSGVFINGKPAARLGDGTAHGGVIVVGNPTVLVGETGPVVPGGGRAGSSGAATSSADSTETGNSGSSAAAPTSSAPTATPVTEGVSTASSGTPTTQGAPGLTDGAAPVPVAPSGRSYGGNPLSCGGRDSSDSKVFKDPATAHKENEAWRKPHVDQGVAQPLEGTNGSPKKVPRADEAGEICTREYQGRTYKVKKNADGFPEFTILETYIDDENINNQDDGAHFAEANRRVRRMLLDNPGLEKELGLDKRQLKFLMSDPPKAKSPPGLTWHHHQDVGKMQLVDEQLHKRFNHVGGMEIWGGGRP